MDIRQIKYFLTVAKEGQITAAAKKLHMTQPPLSQQIKILEEELGVQLLERGSRNIKLTKAGTILRIHGEEILELVNSTVKEIKNLNEEMQGTLNIGTVASSDNVTLPKIINSFHEKYPDVNFQIWEGDTYRVEELLNNGIVDIGIIRTPFNFDMYESIIMPDDPMIAVANFRFLDHDGTISLSEIKNMPMIIHRRYEDNILEACKKEGFKPKFFCKCDNMRSMLTWADNGLGVAIVPKSTINIAKNMQLKICEIKEKVLETTAAIVWIKDKRLSPIANNFIENVKIFIS